MKKILNFLKAFVGFPIFIRAWIRSKPVSFEIASNRLSICNACDELDLVTRQCTKCWCFVRLKVKWEKEQCPLGKW